MVALKLEILQESPFASLAEEALLNLLRTSDGVNRALQLKTRQWNITTTQYNVLRILRGAQPNGLSCSAIGSRMINAEPDITRLLARLKRLKLIYQQRDQTDRRVLWTRISEAGLDLLKEMEPMILSFPGEQLRYLSREDLTELIRLLELARKRNQEQQAQLSVAKEQDI
jgi:MarR family transcriptional regulator, organic hydroperoxide resistance regulator